MDDHLIRETAVLAQRSIQAVPDHPAELFRPEVAVPIGHQRVGLGRGDVRFDDPTVSRRHAEFRRDAYGVKVRDVGSLNGTYVNRDRIDEVQLNNGDEVQIGKYRLVYYASGQA